MKMVETIDKTTSYIPLFFQGHLAAWRYGLGFPDKRLRLRFRFFLFIDDLLK